MSSLAFGKRKAECKGFSTAPYSPVWTLAGTLSCVDPRVLSKMGALFEGLATILTLTVPCPSVCSSMLAE